MYWFYLYELSIQNKLLVYPWVPNFNPFHSMTSCSWVTGHFETSALNDPKEQNDLEHYKVHVLLVSPNHTNFSAFHSTTIHFRVTSHFETSGSNDLKITLNTTRQNIPINIYMCYLSIPVWNFSFAIRPAVTRLSKIRIHWMTSEWPWTLNSVPCIH